jgi:hypothetical protein
MTFMHISASRLSSLVDLTWRGRGMLFELHRESSKTLDSGGSLKVGVMVREIYWWRELSDNSEAVESELKVESKGT